MLYSFLDDNVHYQSEFLRYECVYLLYDILAVLMTDLKEKKNNSLCDEIEEILELLILLTNSDKIRNTL